MSTVELNPLPSGPEQSKKLNTSVPARRSVANVLHRPETNISRLLDSYRDNPRFAKPVTLAEFMLRISQIPRLAHRFEETNGFSLPNDMSNSQVRLSTGMISSRYHHRDVQKEMNMPIPVIREMLLLAYEATPRAISYAVTGYTASDFISYIYQDVLEKDMNLPLVERKQPFVDRVQDIKQWLTTAGIQAKGKNFPRRHIRRRLMALLDRGNHQIVSLFEDREMPTDLVYLIHKLMERDDDAGYTQGNIRDFDVIRADFNDLAEHVMRIRYAGTDQEAAKVGVFDRIVCPSIVADFSTHEIDLPRGKSVGRNNGIGQRKSDKAKELRLQKKAAREQKALEAELAKNAKKDKQEAERKRKADQRFEARVGKLVAKLAKNATTDEELASLDGLARLQLAQRDERARLNAASTDATSSERNQVAGAAASKSAPRAPQPAGSLKPAQNDDDGQTALDSLDDLLK